MSGTEMGPIEWVFDEDDIARLLDAISSANEVVFDTETTGLVEHAVTGGEQNGGIAARISMATFTLPQGDGVDPTTWILPLSHPQGPFSGIWRDVLRRVARRMRSRSKPLTGQHIKFDCKWVEATCGIDISHLVYWDTMVSAHLLDETISTKLKERAPAEFGIERWDEDIDLSKPGASERTDIWLLGEYAARDTYWTWRLASKHRYDMMLGHPEDAVEPDEIQLARLGRVAKLVAMPTIASLAAIEQRGFALDVDWVRSRLAEEEARATEALDQMAEQYGQDRDAATSAATATWFKRFTELAVEAGDLRIISLTDTGNPQWNKATLRRLERWGSTVATMVLTQRDASKKAEFLRSWLDHVTPAGNIHTQYNSGRVVTGRLSSQEPNMQQVTKVLKPAFIPRPGNVIIDLDYSAIEMRVAAFISRCEPMMAAFIKGLDPHRIMAGELTGKLPEDVTADERQGGKAGNFGLIFGMSPEGYQVYAEDVYGVILTLAEAQVAHRAFFKLWEGMEEWHARVQRKVIRDGYVTSPIGRVRRLPDVWSENYSLANYAKRQAINSPVQGFASDLMQIAAASIQGRLPVAGHPRVEGALIVGTVHDSIVLEAPENDWERVGYECQERMTKDILPVLARMDCHLDVPLAAEVTAGTRWGLKDVGELIVAQNVHVK